MSPDVQVQHSDKPGITVTVTTVPADVAWYGAKLGFGFAWGVSFAIALGTLGYRLNHWVFG